MDYAVVTLKLLNPHLVTDEHLNTTVTPAVQANSHTHKLIKLFQKSLNLFLSFMLSVDITLALIAYN